MPNLLFEQRKTTRTAHPCRRRPDWVVRAQGFSLLELVVVIGIIAVLLGFAIRKFEAMQVDAERVALEQVVAALRSANGIKVASYIARNDTAGIRALEGSNPMDRLAEKPNTYVGALPAADPAKIEGGRWYFDTASKTLVYRVRFGDYFQSPLGQPARARFAVKLVYTDKNRNGRFDAGVEEMEGVQVAALEPYTWTD